MSRRRKYGNEPTERFGLLFDSQKEANAYAELRARADAGEIEDLECQPNYELQPAFRDHDGRKVQAITYTPDFRYTDLRTNERVVVEVKSRATKTQASVLRMKLFKFRYQNVRFVLWE
jgi:hypothetical protein